MGWNLTFKNVGLSILLIVVKMGLNYYYCRHREIDKFELIIGYWRVSYFCIIHLRVKNVKGSK